MRQGSGVEAVVEYEVKARTRWAGTPYTTISLPNEEGSDVQRIPAKLRLQVSVLRSLRTGSPANFSPALIREREHPLKDNPEHEKLSHSIEGCFKPSPCSIAHEAVMHTTGLLPYFGLGCRVAVRPASA